MTHDVRVWYDSKKPKAMFHALDRWLPIAGLLDRGYEMRLHGLYQNVSDNI